MKKLMMMAMMLVASATAFAGDSDALKAILKAKTYADAESLLNGSLAQLASDAEKAKAYNKLVDLAYEKFKKEDDINTTNKVMQKNDPVDTEGMLKAGQNALKCAMECDKYDQLPNEKGKVAMKFRQKNQDRTKAIRTSLLQAGIDLVNAEKNKEAFDNFDIYIATSKAPFFEGVEGVAKNDPNLGVAAFYGGRAAVQLENYAKATEFFKIGVADTTKQIHDLSFEFLLYSMRLSQKTAADSAKYITDMAELMAQYPDNEKVFIQLAESYYLRGKVDELIKLADDFSTKNPESPYSDFFKGSVYLEIEKYKDLKKAQDYFSKIPEGSPIYLNALFNLGTCHQNMAATFSDEASKKTGQIGSEDKKTLIEMLNEARKCYEKCKELDPDEKTVKWAYRLESISYNIDQLNGMK